MSLFLFGCKFMLANLLIYSEIRKVSTKEVKWQGEKYIEVTVKAQANNETAERSCLIKKERRGLLLLPGYYLIR
ncbi:hypothetical protein CA592_12620 [Anoxybacillus flavithermus]|nr:hypothetical protein CA592_12620 [Anoxybacillus flavithermus]